jgi:hypothetical protein
LERSASACSYRRWNTANLLPAAPGCGDAGKPKQQQQQQTGRRRGVHLREGACAGRVSEQNA